MTSRPPPLTEDNAVGNGTPATADLVRVQTAILTSNAVVLGAVTQFRTGMDKRLDRQFGETNAKINELAVQVDGVCNQVDALEEARRLAQALAAQANEHAKAADAVAVQHSLSTNQRMAIVVSAIAACGGVILGLLNFAVGK